MPIENKPGFKITNARELDLLKERIISGGEVTFEEAVGLIEIREAGLLERLFQAARELTFHFHSNRPALCSLINAKSYLCREDCKFCSQSLHYETGVERFELVSEEEVLQAAKQCESRGIESFCIVTSGAELDKDEFDRVVRMFERLKRETSLHLDGSLGWLSDERITRLKAAGVRRINCNLQTSEAFYSEIVTTHPYEKRCRELKNLQKGGMEICAGGILNLGETAEDRIRLAFELKPFHPLCLPLNFLNPRPGTPLEGRPLPDPQEMVKTVAVFRFIHPQAKIKLAGGRELNLGSEFQEKALKSGANGLIMGGYLTSGGDPVEKDFAMLERAGFEIPKRDTASPY